MPGPQGVAHLNITAGTLVAVGGIMGYTRKKSLPSLVAGVLLGAAYYGSAYLVDRVDPVKGFQAGAATSAFLTAAMLPRYLKTKAFIPAGKKWLVCLVLSRTSASVAVSVTKCLF